MDSIGSLVFDVEHFGHRRAEDVAVQQADFVTQACQGDGEVGRNGALAHAALTRAYGDDILHLRQHLSYFGTWLRLEFRLDFHLYVLAAVVFDSRLGSLHRRL